jgi:drug/metabolite transporter (DMT)-like permease
MENLYLHNLAPGVASLFTSSGLFPRHGQTVPPSQPYLPRIPKHWDFHGAFVEDHQLRQKAFYQRLYMAAFGGIALIGPMLVMTLHNTKVTALVTTSVFVTVVASLLAWFMEDATPKDIMGATAAYAAVLVVFVGTST